MIKTIDRVFGVLLLVGATLHAYGSITTYRAGSEVLVWALSGSLAAALIAVLNIVRSGRVNDRTIAWITFAASLSWLGVAVGYGAAIGHIVDPRVIWHVVCALALAAFSIRSALLDAPRPST